MPKIRYIYVNQLIFSMFVIFIFVGNSIAAKNLKELANDSISKSLINIYQEGVNEVPVSNTAINHIISDQPIKNIKLPESATLEVSEGDSNNAFLEIKGTKPELIYVTTETTVYAISLVPTEIGAQKLHLVFDKKEKVIVPLIGNERENVAVKLIKEAYKEGELLDKARVSTKLSKKVKFINYIELMEYRRYEWEEDELFLTVYILRLEKDAKFEKLDITERMFLIPELCESPLGISISRDYLTKNDYTRVFIVGRR
jgi:hypothetical protein